MSPDPSPVTILLPLFNGEQFLSEQLESLLRQNHVAWRCLMRDDGSSDHTQTLARRFEKKHPDRFELIQDSLGNLGVIGCLNVLARHADGELFALCDQDDVWHPDKLSQAVASLARLAAPPGIPALTFCDMCVTDPDLHPLADSFWALQGSRRYAVGLCGMPVLNAVAGCTMVGNRALMAAAFPVPASAPMHDHWIALVARYAGVHIAIDAPLVLYRQHGRNQRGATPPAKLAARVTRRLAGLGQFIADARHGRAARLAMLGELLARNVPGTRVADCHAAMRAETSNPLSRLQFLLRAGISPADAFTYWLA